MNYTYLQPQIAFLQRKGYKMTLEDRSQWILVEGSTLPDSGVWTNQERKRIAHVSIMIDLPPDFPMIVPGVGLGHPSYAIHIPKLYFNGQRLSDTYDCQHHPWSWLCFQKMDWHSKYNLITLLQIIEYSIEHRASKT
jgi:hypothetical protein